MKRRNNWWVWVASVVVVLSSFFGAVWWYRRAPIRQNQTIAFIISSAPSVALFIRDVRDMIDLFSDTYKVPVKRYVSDGSSSSVLRLLEQIYADGIRKVIGPSTSHEIDESVQRFIAAHSDMSLVVVSVTSPRIGERVTMPNFYRFVAADDLLVEVYAQILPFRLPHLKHIVLLIRDDSWGRAIWQLVQLKITKVLPQVSMHEFFYDPPEKFKDKEQFKKNLEGVIQSARDVLSKKSDTAVISFSFDEIGEYVNLIRKDPVFKVPHFGSDVVAYSTSLIEDSLAAQFLSDVKFEAIVFVANNAYSAKRLDVARAIYERRKQAGFSGAIPSQYAFAVYDAMECLSLCSNANEFKKILTNYYGTTGYMELDHRGARRTGTFMGIGLIGDGTRYRWLPFTLVRHEVFFKQFGVTEWILTDVAPTYRVTWEPGLEVKVGTMGLDLTDLIDPFKPEHNFFLVSNAEYVTVRYTDHGVNREFLVYPALQRDGIQVYVDTNTKDLWSMRAVDNLHIDPRALRPLSVVADAPAPAPAVADKKGLS